MTRLLVAAAMAAAAVGLVHVFRNRVLAGLLPRLVDALRRRFGPAADVQQATLDERWNLELEGVRLPLPRGVIVEVETARVTGLLTLGWRVTEARGTLTLVGDETPLAALALPFCFCADAEAPLPVHGRVEIREGTWAHRRDDLKGTPYVNADLEVSGGLAGFAIRGGRVHLGEGVLHVRAELPFASGELRAEPLPRSVVEHLVALADPTLELPLPADLALSGTLTREPGAAWKLNADATATATAVTLDATLSTEGELSGDLSGSTTLAQLKALGYVPEGAGEVRAVALVSGSLADPVLDGTATCPELEVRGQRVLDLKAPFRLHASELVVSGATARVLDGAVTASSTVEFGIWPVQHASEVSFERLLVTGPLSAAVSGRARVVGQGGDPELVTAEGEVALEDPDYRFIRRAESALAGFGLPLPPTRGEGPARAQVAVSNGVLKLTQIAGGVPGVAFRGEASVRPDGRIGGRLTLRPEAAYLAQSRMLGAGAALPAVEVPVSLAGTVADPVVQVDIAGALGGILRGGGVAGVVGAVGAFLQKETARAGLPRRGPEMDALIARILEGGAEADQLMDRLIDSGITPDEVRELIADYRRRTGG